MGSYDLNQLEKWNCFINMVSAYLTYEQTINENKIEEPPFFLDWICNYEKHLGKLGI